MSKRALPEAELAAGTLVIADLHVDLEDGRAVERFLEFLGRAADVPRLIVLGDLFEYWLGRAHLEHENGRRVVAAFAERAERGLATDVVHGNRDFLLDARFGREARAGVYPFGLVGRLPGGGRLGLIHGDELATRDRSYQRLRSVLRSRAVTGLVPRLPLRVSRGLARRLRRASARSNLRAPDGIKALQPQAAADTLGDLGLDLLVCGHAHLYRDERPGDAGRWLVLDAFGGARDTLRVEAAGAAEPVSVVSSGSIA